jgi:enamine deaminase RidA (YjgF/YER057c/UK114 family)
MGRVEARLAELGPAPPPLAASGGIVLPFPWVGRRGAVAFVSGHGRQEPDGALAGPLSKVGEAVSLEEARGLARKVALSMLGSLARELGEFDRVAGWRRVFGMINAAPGFDRRPAVINGFSNVILDVFRPETGRHARSAIGVGSLPFNIPVEIETEIEIAP